MKNFWEFWGIFFGIFLEYFGIYLEFIWNFLEFFLKLFENFSEGIFLEEFFWRNFLEGFLGGFFWEDFWEDCIWRNSLFYFNVEGIDLFVKILVFVKILGKSRRRKEGRRTKFRSLEVRLQVHRT